MRLTGVGIIRRDYSPGLFARRSFLARREWHFSKTTTSCLANNLPQQPLKAARPTLFEWLFDTGSQTLWTV
jgi:hypothetical protein